MEIKIKMKEPYIYKREVSNQKLEKIAKILSRSFPELDIQVIQSQKDQVSNPLRSDCGVEKISEKETNEFFQKVEINKRKNGAGCFVVIMIVLLLSLGMCQDNKSNYSSYSSGSASGGGAYGYYGNQKITNDEMETHTRFLQEHGLSREEAQKALDSVIIKSR